MSDNNHTMSTSAAISAARCIQMLPTTGDVHNNTRLTPRTRTRQERLARGAWPALQVAPTQMGLLALSLCEKEEEVCTCKSTRKLCACQTDCRKSTGGSLSLERHLFVGRNSCSLWASCFKKGHKHVMQQAGRETDFKGHPTGPSVLFDLF